MNTQSNTYTFIYASVMVVVVAAVLSFAALQLKPLQNKNKEIEKKQYILKSVNIASTPENAENLYKQMIIESYVVNTKGEKVEGDAFTVDMTKETVKAPEKRKLPVYIFQNKEGEQKIIIPVRGKGLWDPSGDICH